MNDVKRRDPSGALPIPAAKVNTPKTAGKARGVGSQAPDHNVERELATMQLGEQPAPRFVAAVQIATDRALSRSAAPGVHLREAGHMRQAAAALGRRNQLAAAEQHPLTQAVKNAALEYASGSFKPSTLEGVPRDLELDMAVNKQVNTTYMEASENPAKRRAGTQAFEASIARLSDFTPAQQQKFGVNLFESYVRSQGRVSLDTAVARVAAAPNMHATATAWLEGMMGAATKRKPEVEAMLREQPAVQKFLREGTEDMVLMAKAKNAGVTLPAADNWARGNRMPGVVMEAAVDKTGKIFAAIADGNEAGGNAQLGQLRELYAAAEAHLARS